MLLASLLCAAMATAPIFRLIARLLRTGYTGLWFWQNVAVMMVVTLVMAVTHLIQIALWALAFLMVGEIATFETAFYFSAENYTSLGYGDIVLSGQWRLLGPLEAINGLLLFGLSTALMFAVMSHLIMDRLRFQLGHPPAIQVDKPSDR
jgi:hypothetical protein